MTDAAWFLWCAWIAASGAALVCLGIAMHHCRKAQEICQRMIRGIEKSQRLIEEARRAVR
jgi:hypothetical protein